MPTPPHSDYAHIPTLEDVASTEAQRRFKCLLLLREAQTFSELAARSKKRGWRLMASSYAFKAVKLQRHAQFLYPV